MFIKNRFLFLMIFIALNAILLTGCGKKPDNKADTMNSKMTGLSAPLSDETGKEDDNQADISKQPSESDNGQGATPTETPADTPDLQAEAAVNNGGLYVEYNGYTYYREYNAESYDASGLWGDYYAIAGVSKNMMRLKEDGTCETAFSDDGAGEIYICNDRMYLQKPTDYGAAVYSVKLDGSDYKEIGKGTIAGIDEASKTLVCMMLNQDYSYILETVNCLTKEVTILDLSIPCAEVLAVRDGFVYYSGVVDYEASALGAMKLCRVAVDGTAESLLAESSADLYDFASDGTETPCIQFVEDTIYFSYGGYAGTGNFYQGGRIARVNIDGSDFRVLAGSTDDDLTYESFYVSRQNNMYILYYNDFSDSEGTVRALDLSTGEVTTTSFPIYQEGAPFEFNDGVYIYQNASPVMTKLIPAIDYTSLGFGIDDYYYRIHDIEICGDWVYYRLEANESNPEASIGWREGYSRIKTQVIREEIGKGEKEVLIEY